MNSALRRKSLKDDDALAAAMRAAAAARDGCMCERGALCAAERGIAWKRWKHAQLVAHRTNRKETHMKGMRETITIVATRPTIHTHITPQSTNDLAASPRRQGR